MIYNYACQKCGGRWLAAPTGVEETCPWCASKATIDRLTKHVEHLERLLVDELEAPPAQKAIEKAAKESDNPALFQADSIACDKCGGMAYLIGRCHLCFSCGESMGCS